MSDAVELDFAGPELVFWVSGIPAPGGSKSFMGFSKKGRAILMDAGGKRNKTWRAVVAMTARAVAKEILEGPIELTCEFTMPRPKKHFYTDKKRLGKLRSDAPHFHIFAPDTTKLLRSTEDAMKGITWVDDSQVVRQFAGKIYGDKPGCLIKISKL